MSNPGNSSESAKLMTFQKPKCLALVFCENVIEDKHTNNKSLIGLFNRVQAIQLPLVHPQFYIVVSLTNGRGEVPIDVSISSLTTGEIVLKISGNAIFNDPLGVIDLVLQCRNVPFKTAGIYAIAVLCGNEQIVERRFQVAIKERREK